MFLENLKDFKNQKLAFTTPTCMSVIPKNFNKNQFYNENNKIKFGLK